MSSVDIYPQPYIHQSFMDNPGILTISQRNYYIVPSYPQRIFDTNITNYHLVNSENQPLNHELNLSCDDNNPVIIDPNDDPVIINPNDESLDYTTKSDNIRWCVGSCMTFILCVITACLIVSLRPS
jgi:hypothetical protein